MTVSTLLWVDDVVLFEKDPKKLQEMLNKVDHVAKTYHLEFGESKSKVMKIGNSKDRPIIRLGEMELEYVEHYKYLGYIQEEKNTNETYVRSLKGKVEAAYQKSLALAPNPTLCLVEMRTTLETCIVPIITYGGETLELRTNKEGKEINRMLENIIKVPRGTPTEAK